jgi:anti-sigma regulatory factor (Ser/Thr protein kinase)
MDLDFENACINHNEFFLEEVINISNVNFFTPWGLGIVCLKAIENKNKNERRIILPKNPDTLAYLKRMHFDQLLRSFGYHDQIASMGLISQSEKENLNIHEILHCGFRDEFTARLDSKIRKMFKNFGMNEEDEQFATAIVGELGNNVFDHNEGLWPTEIRGAIILAQNYPKMKRIEIVIADPGVGFLKSLKPAKQDLKNEIEAIQLGLSGVTGRVGENRGNGLILVQKWTLDKFKGILRIQSGEGLVQVSGSGEGHGNFHDIKGTLASFVVSYS